MIKIMIKIMISDQLNIHVKKRPCELIFIILDNKIGQKVMSFVHVQVYPKVKLANLSWVYSKYSTLD